MKYYSVGLDIGTGSVGWAVIDEAYKLIKLNGKDAWGTFLFDDAKKAIKTRTKRAQRRRQYRRNERIRLLQELMSSDVLAVDDSFFNRLKESNLRSDLVNTPYNRSNYYNLFEGEYTDKDYYKDYKTIYHLRERLCTYQEKMDIRLVYLALHHILKYRGNFLYEGKEISSASAMLKDSLIELFILIDELYDIKSDYVFQLDKIIDILKDKNIPKAWKNDRLKLIFDDKTNKKLYENILNAILGYSFNLGDILNFEEPLTDDDDKIIKISFAKTDYDENEEKYLAFADDKSEVLLCLKAIYNARLFENITNGQSNISKAMILKYQNHKEDLIIFKRLLKNAFPIEINPKTNKPFYTEYSKMFRSKAGINYVNYIGSNTNGRRYTKKVSKEDFYTHVKKVLENIDDCSDKKYCLEKIELDNFLPLLNTVENAAIPYQMNKQELVQIIDNQMQYYPSLRENKDKILLLLEFKRPYYAGPLKGKFSWCTQIINERVTPWNFNQLVNTDALAESFITRMTNYCNIFREESSLPLNSILYQAYITLNELNKIKYQGKIINTVWKKQLFINLCLKHKTVKTTAIAKELAKIINRPVEENDITGLSEDKLNGSMSSYIDFRAKLDEGFNLKDIEKYEEAIRIISIFDDKKIRKNRLKDIGFNNENIELLSKLNYKGWGRYSKKLLNGILSYDNKTIIQTLFDTDKHINELLFDAKFGFKDKIESTDEQIKDFNYDRDVKDLYCSPSVKKAIWNALKIVEEITKVAKCEPNKIFLEDTHEVREKRRTNSKVKKLLELYNKIKKDEYFNNDTYSVVQSYNKNNSKLDNDKLYLWLLQLGRCMYTGEIIDFDQLSECEIDHIVPRSYIKDDSIENRVLVKKLENQYKTDNLCINPIIKSKMLGFWTYLLKGHFIGAKKYNNLTRGEYSDSEKIGFINRQLVETNQIIKEVRNILQKRYPNADIMGIRAGMNSNFRHKYSQRNKAGFYKIRALNNFHHAKDAYLTAVLGQFTTVACPLWGQDKLNRSLKYYIANNEQARDSIATLVNKRYGLILDLMEYGDMDKFEISEDGEYLWDNQRYMNIFATMEKNNCIVVKKKPYLANSDFYKQTICSPKAGKKNLLPLKSKNGIDMPTDIYGGYLEEHPAFFAIVEYVKQTKKTSETRYALSKVPVLKVVESKKNPEIIVDYIKSIYGESAKVLRQIFKYQLININGQLCYITGESELNNATELFVDSKFDRLLYLITNDKINVNSEEKMSEEKMIVFNNEVKDFIGHYIYKLRRHFPLYSNFADALENILSQKYCDINLAQKIQLVKQMLIVSDTTASRIELDKSLDGGGFGRLTKTVYPNEVQWIDNSCTGLYSHTADGVKCL